MEEAKQQVPEELQNVDPSGKGATPEETQKPAEPETTSPPVVVPDLSAEEVEPKAEGVQEAEEEAETEEEPKPEEEKKNYVPQDRFDEVYAKQKRLERKLKLLEKTGTPSVPSYDIGEVNVKEVLGLTQQQSDKLDEWYEKDPLSAQAWVNDKIQEVKQQYKQFHTEFALNQQVLQEKHPDMFKINPATGQRELDLTTQKAQVFNRIAEENPYLLDSPQGPKVAMILMEEELGIRGGGKVNANALIEKGKKAEAERIKRLANTPVVKTASAPKAPTSAKLTPAQKAVAAKAGLTEEEYAANLQSMKSA